MFSPSFPKPPSVPRASPRSDMSGSLARQGGGGAMLHRGTGPEGQASRTWTQHPLHPNSWRPQKCVKSQENQLPRKGVRNHSLFRPDVAQNELRLYKGPQVWRRVPQQQACLQTLTCSNQNPHSTDVSQYLQCANTCVHERCFLTSRQDKMYPVRMWVERWG